MPDVAAHSVPPVHSGFVHPQPAALGAVGAALDLDLVQRRKAHGAGALAQLGH